MPAELGAGVLDDWTARFVAQFAAPRAQRLTLERDSRTEHVVIDVDAEAWAVVFQKGARRMVRQDGAARLWDEITECLAQWQAAARPPTGCGCTSALTDSASPGRDREPPATLPRLTTYRTPRWPDPWNPPERGPGRRSLALGR